MDSSSTVTSKGQVTIPARVRAALGIQQGSRLLFHVEDDTMVVEEPISRRRAVVRRFPDFFDLAGSVAVPEEIKGKPWGAVRTQARARRARDKS